MSDADQRSILQRLSRGEMSTDEAEQLLAALGQDDEAAGDTGEPAEVPDDAEVATATRAVEPTAADSTRLLDTRPPAPAAPPSPEATDPSEQVGEILRQVRVELNGPDLAEVVGDEGLAEPYVEGPASVRTITDDDRYRLTAELSDDALVHVPAAVDLELVVNSPDVTVRQIRGRLDADLNVGNASLGLITLTQGESRVRANCGDLTLIFTPGSDVTVRQRCCGSLSAEGGFVKTGRGVWTLGAGTASLEIDGNLGSITLVGSGADQ
jgi:hypothetical protein